MSICTLIREMWALDYCPGCLLHITFSSDVRWVAVWTGPSLQWDPSSWMPSPGWLAWWQLSACLLLICRSVLVQVLGSARFYAGVFLSVFGYTSVFKIMFVLLNCAVLWKSQRKQPFINICKNKLVNTPSITAMKYLWFMSHQHWYCLVWKCVLTQFYWNLPKMDARKMPHTVLFSLKKNL